MSRFAVILTHDRHELLANCVKSIAPQVGKVIVIDNDSAQRVTYDEVAAFAPRPIILRIPGPPNIAAMWNKALDVATLEHRHGPEPLYVAFLCDDTIVPEGWFDAVVEAMAETGAAAGASNGFHTPGVRVVKTEPDRDLAGRMPGWAFVIDGKRGLRADERLHWWWCDTDLDWKARTAGGMVMISGYPVHNIHPNDYTTRDPALYERSGADGVAFTYIWGSKPW